MIISKIIIELFSPNEISNWIILNYDIKTEIKNGMLFCEKNYKQICNDLQTSINEEYMFHGLLFVEVVFEPNKINLIIKELEKIEPIYPSIIKNNKFKFL